MRQSTKTLARLSAPLVAAALLLGMAAVPAWAYFTAWDEANGGMTIHKPGTEITEKYGAGEKSVVITNKDDSVPVHVRAKAFIPADLLEKAEVGGKGWTATGGKDDWYTYDAVLEPGKNTTPLLVKINFPFTSSDVATSTSTVTDDPATSGETEGRSTLSVETADGTTYNVVVVYEMQLLSYDDAGNVQPANWQ